MPVKNRPSVSAVLSGHSIPFVSMAAFFCRHPGAPAQPSATHRGPPAARPPPLRALAARACHAPSPREADAYGTGQAPAGSCARLGSAPRPVRGEVDHTAPPRLRRVMRRGSRQPAARSATRAARIRGCAVAADNAAAAREAEYVFLCVKPQVMEGVVKELAPVLSDKPDTVLVSIAAGLQIATLRQWLGLPNPILRIMPNTPASIGMGMLALTGEPDAREEHYQAVETILARAGRVERLAEHQMDAFSAVAGCGPAFVYPFIEALADGGVKVGLPRSQAMVYAAQMVLGSAALVLESGKHPGQLKDEVCSPGGSTIAGVAALEARALRSAAIEAVEAAYHRNVELGKV